MQRHRLDPQVEALTQKQDVSSFADARWPEGLCDDGDVDIAVRSRNPLCHRPIEQDAAHGNPSLEKCLLEAPGQSQCFGAVHSWREERSDSTRKSQVLTFSGVASRSAHWGSSYRAATAN